MPSHSENSTGYGPTIPANLIFDGNDDNYELWEIKFLAHLTLKGLDEALEQDENESNTNESATSSGANSGDKMNRKIFAELTQRLDEKSLSLICREAKNDGRKSLKILREHYMGKTYPRIIENYNRLVTLKKEENESVIDYIIKAEKAASALQNAGETVSDGLLVSLALRGLPPSYISFKSVIYQSKEPVPFNQFKQSLKSFEENTREERKEDKIFATSDKKTNSNLKCYSCGENGHRQFQCRRKENNKWCNYCKMNNHEVKECWKLRKIYGAPNTRMDEDATVSTATDGHFAMKVSVSDVNIVNKCTEGTTMLLVDTGATSHIVTDRNKFLTIDPNFDASNHYIELADGSRSRIVTCKGDASVTLTDSSGTDRNILLKNALCVPSFKQDIFSVHAATQQGVRVKFSQHSSNLSKDGITFDICKKGKLYYVNKSAASDVVSRSLQEWHAVLGHCNINDVKKLPEVVNGMNIDSRKDFDCDVCIKGKFSQYRNRLPDTKARHTLDLVHCDIAGPIDPIARDNFKYAINFVDDRSGYIFVYLLKNRSDAVIALKRFLADTAPYGRVKCIRTDNALEFTGGEFEHVLSERGVKHEFSSPYAPHQNGTAERSWRSIMEMTRCLLIEANLCRTLWAYALKTAVYIRNRCFNSRIKMTPHELLTSKRPSLSNMHIFGAKCFAYVQQKKKLDDRAEEGIFVGYDTQSPAYFVYFPTQNKVDKVRMVKFPGVADVIANKAPMQPQADIESEVPTYEYCLPETESETNCNDAETNDNDSLKDHHEKETTSDGRFPVRVRNKPKYLEDYVQYSLDYCYRLSDIPNNYNDAAHSRDATAWREAMEDELAALKDSDTYELCPLPTGRSPIGSRWVYSVKVGPNDEQKYKARLVAKGYNQVPGIDYQETFSPTAKITSIRVVLQLAAQNDYIVSQMDVKSAYLNAEIDTEVYLEQPEGYSVSNDGGNKLYWKLKKSLYGLKQSGRNWNEMLHSFLTSEGFDQSNADGCVYSRQAEQSTAIIVVWVDDLLIVSDSADTMKAIKASLFKAFKMKDLGKLAWFIGINFEISDNKITMNQSKNISKVLERFGMSDCTPKLNISDVDVDLVVSDAICSKPADVKLYQEMIGSLIYIMSCTRPDICYIVSKLSQAMQRPSAAHMNAAKDVLRYLKGTIDYCLTFKKSDRVELFGFCDSDWGSNSDRKSITGYCFKLAKNGCLISWNTKKQPLVALSSCEAEYVAMTSAVQEAKFLRMLLNDMFIKSPDPTVIFADNQGAIFIAKNPVNRQRTKHIDIKYHFIRSEIKNKLVDVQYVPSDKNVADVFTKCLPRNKANSFIEAIGFSVDK